MSLSPAAGYEHVDLAKRGAALIGWAPAEGRPGRVSHCHSLDQVQRSSLKPALFGAAHCCNGCNLGAQCIP